MLASHRDGEITFYEELGLAPSASPEEIRDAFRLNVRLLHPDQQTDPQLKEIAETQMRKLNRIYAILSDPDRRRDYDDMLDEEFPTPLIMDSPSPGLRKLAARLAWAGAIVISAGVLMWLASENTPGVQSRGLDPATSAGAPSNGFPDTPSTPQFGDSAPEVSQLRAALRAAIMERDAAIHELDRLRGNTADSKSVTAAPPEENGPRPPVTITELPSTPKAPLSATSLLPRPVLPRADRPANRQLGGFWFYAKPPEGQVNKNSKLYPPEYIEATITEEGSAVHGTFRARYVIVDRPISPDVNFTFNGTQIGPQLNCPWTGAGGAKGDLTVKLTSDNSMRIDWNASELGSLGLSSGTAVLTRRIE
jgi:hypothetical protein